MKSIQTMAGVAMLTAITQGQMKAELRCNGTPGFFERLADYRFRKPRACACAVHVERIEAAVDSIVGRDRSVSVQQTQRISLPAQPALSR
jgi:hypothetical protein